MLTGQIADFLNRIFSFGISIVILSVPPYLYRRSFSKFLPKLWAHAYFRRAVDCSIIMLPILLIVSMFGVGETKGGGLHIPVEMRHEIDSQLAGKEIQGEAYDQLDGLTRVQYFVDRFPLFVLLPCLVVGFAGYSIERQKAALKGAKDAG